MRRLPKGAIVWIVVVAFLLVVGGVEIVITHSLHGGGSQDNNTDPDGMSVVATVR